MAGQDERRGRRVAAAATLAATVVVAAFLYMVGRVTSQTADNALGRRASTSTVPSGGAQSGAAPSTGPAAHNRSDPPNPPHWVPVPTTRPAARYVAPAVVATAVTACKASGAGGVVTYTATFAGGAAWTPGGNFHDGAFTISVRGGANVNTVIAGAPLTDTIDRRPVYVAFPSRLVLNARC